MNCSILWFRLDLRLHDNEALLEAVRNADELVPVYIFDRDAGRSGTHRTKFLSESVSELRAQLRSVGSDLIVRQGNPVEILYQLALDTKSRFVYCNRERTHEEVEVQDGVEQKLWTIGRELRYTRGKMLYYTSDLPFPITHCPDSYFSFRKEVEMVTPVRYPLEVPVVFPPMAQDLDPGEIPISNFGCVGKEAKRTALFRGGEKQGLKVLEEKFTSQVPDHLNGGCNSLSPWLSIGCLSPKKVYHHLRISGVGTEAITQNLIYRDYLRLMGKKYGNRIFHLSGVKGMKPTYVRDEKALISWQEGKTGVPIIDAAMHQLNHTGWIPDVLRKTVANYLIKVLHLDWRLGAAYFETMLIDYDPCSNWVSWLNLAGVGPDSRDDRIIHYDLVGKKLDPDGSYVKLWNS